MYRLTILPFVAFAAVQVLATPVPQASSDCISSCQSVVTAATTCQSQPAAQQVSCICSSSGFLSSVQACVSCASISTSQQQQVQQLIDAALTGGSGSSAAASSSSSGPGSSSAPASSVTSGAGASAARVTGTAPVTISAFRPNVLSSVNRTYLIQSTGGVNTTIEAVVTTTLAAANATVTATITDDLVLGPSAIAENIRYNGLSDLAMCQILAQNGTTNSTLASCQEVILSGTQVLVSTAYTLTGATRPYTAIPAPSNVTFGASASSTASLVPAASSSASA
ncbi:hypothetical protein EMMF5_004883 [Cystobasidiomycetes sp. EMM_F5]